MRKFATDVNCKSHLVSSYHYYVFQVFVSLCWYTIPYCHLKMKPEMEEELELSLMTL